MRRYLPFIIMINALGALGSDLYLPSLPAIAQYFQVTHNASQYTFTYYMYGNALGILLAGLTSDAFGRKKPIMIGIIVFFLGSLQCVMATSIYQMQIGRIFQGLGGGVGVSARAILRDCFSGGELARYVAYFSMGMVAIIAMAPMIGGYIQQYWVWQGSFIVLMAFTAGLFTILLPLLPETNVNQNIAFLKPQYIKINVIELFSNRYFLSCTLGIMFLWGGLQAWLTAAPVLIQDLLGFSPVMFGWIAFITGLTYSTGALLTGLLSHVIDTVKVSYMGAMIILLTSLGFFILGILGMTNTWSVLCSLLLFMFGTSLVYSVLYAMALMPFPKTAGIAGSFVGFLQILGGAIASNVVAFLPETSQVPLSLVLMVCSFSVVIIHFFVRHYASVYHRDEE